MRVPLSRGLSSLSQRSASRTSLAEALRRGAPIDVHPEVEEALQSHKPVVALETTIVTHGMPPPTNLNCAQSVESIVRAQGAIPATIGFIGGRVKIGLESQEMEYLADTNNNKGAVKISRRDVGAAIALKKDGGTTCAATSMFATLAGIKVFATGGLGGVHRGGENSMDVSADLAELTRCPVGLVSAGVKSILDIGRTLEYLETLGVPVVTYGKTNDFPAFFTARSGFKSPWKVDNPEAAARILHTHWQLGMETGAIFAAPIPEQYEATGQELQKSVEQAVRESEENGVSKIGKEATPWLLNRVRELTDGKSLPSNVALIENTAAIGGKIAVAYSKLASGEAEDKVITDNTQPGILEHPHSKQKQTSVSSGTELEAPKLVVIGSAAVDITARALVSTSSLGTHSTLPGSVSVSLGGVGRNVAEAAHRISRKPHAVQLVSATGGDPFGHLLRDQTARLGMRTDGLLEITTARSAVCNMVLDGQGGLTGGVADMKIVDELKGDIVLDQLRKTAPTLVALDGNLSDKTISAVVQHCEKASIPIFFEPTSVTKSTKILPSISAALKKSFSGSPVAFASPNLLELKHLYDCANSDDYELTSHPSWWQALDAFGLSSSWRMDLDFFARMPVSDEEPNKGSLDFIVEQGIAQMAVRLLPFIANLVVKCGDRGVIVVSRLSGEKASSSGWANEYKSNLRERFIISRGRDELVVLKHYPSVLIEQESIVNVTGAGDTLVGSMLADLMQDPKAFEGPETLGRMIGRAQRAAVLTLRSSLAVSPELDRLG